MQGDKEIGRMREATMVKISTKKKLKLKCWTGGTKECGQTRKEKKWKRKVGQLKTRFIKIIRLSWSLNQS